ncbi:MAG: tyrosine-type recombinase/integrase [Treponema sp.]|jgi:integrase|nr:tyrosine-type recombinase/integrase [Treponema sp.]
MTHLPFSVFKRKGRKIYYVQFKSSDGSYLPAVSTGQTTKTQAIEISFKWFREGRPVQGSKVSISIKDALRSVDTAAEAEFICGELKRLGFLKAYVVAGSKQAVDFGIFLQEFWDFDNSPYIKERLRKNHGIHKNYTIDQKLSVNKYWVPFFKGRVLGGITRQDIENFIDDIASRKIVREQALPDGKIEKNERNLSAGRKNRILKAGIIPLRWAFAKEILEKDVTASMTLFSEKSAERHILPPEIATALFKVEWPDGRVRLANILAAVTGLRLGEIQGLQVQDLGKERLYIRHSWNRRDKLKTTKNNTDRTVELPFPGLIEDLLKVAGQNPHGASMDSYVFWAEKNPAKPIEDRLILAGLRDALVKTGMSEKSAGVYVFHGWRHFFTSYMRGRLADKLIQAETGHKSLAMLGRYSEHQLAGDREKIQKVKKDVFGSLMASQQPLLPFSGGAVQG